jgi:transposase
MPEPTGCVRCCARAETYCSNCDLFVGLPGLHVVDVADGGDADDGGRGRLTVTVESPATIEGCRVCGVIASSRGRRSVILVDAPCFGRQVRLVWRKRTWVYREPACPVGSFTEQDENATPQLRNSQGDSADCSGDHAAGHNAE